MTHKVSVFLFLLLLGVTAEAQEYGFDTWTTANGLPQNTVTKVVQTPDGYLWVSTFDGLARFDGVRFTIFDKGNSKGITNNRFSNLFADREGVVYALTEDDIVTVYRNGSFNSYSQFATSGERVSAFSNDDKGNLVLKTDQGYYSFEGDRFVRKLENKERIYWGKTAFQHSGIRSLEFT